MLKSLFTCLLLVLLAFSASAELYMIVPLERTLTSGSEIELGRVQPGETIEVVFSDTRGSGETEKWQQAVISMDSLPNNWAREDSGVSTKTLVVKVFVPRDAERNAYNFKVELSNPSPLIPDEFVNARVFVERNLVRASVDSLEKGVTVGEPVSFRLTLNNDSIAEHSIAVDSTLSSSWFEPFTVNLKPKETREVDLVVRPRVDGLAFFDFTLSSQTNNDFIGRFNASLEVKPTLKSKYSAALYGFPFNSFSLLAFQLFNSFLGFLIP